jgi:hypothetical protein
MMVYFPHIPKTGGQTLSQGFYQAFGHKKCIKVWDPRFGADVHPQNFSSLNPQQFEGISAVVGHLSLSNFLMNTYAKNEFEKGNVKILTSVRDPIERIISLYNYVFYYEKHPNHNNIKSLSPIDFIMRQPANFQFGFLSPKSESKLDDIFKIMDIFPVENSIHEFTDFFFKNFNVKLGNLQKKNQSVDLANGRKLISINDISKSALGDLQKKHQIDFDLHHKSFECGSSVLNSSNYSAQKLSIFLKKVLDTVFRSILKNYIYR